MGKHYSVDFKEEVVNVYNFGQYGGYHLLQKNMI